MKIRKILKNPWLIGAFFFLLSTLLFYKGYINITTTGNYSPGYVEGVYQAGENVEGDKILEKVEGDHIGGDKIEINIQDTIASVSVNIQDSNLKNSPIITNSPNTKIDYSVKINKILPEIKIGTITDMNITGMSPYKYSFVFRYSIRMDTPSSFEVEYIDLEFYEIIEGDDGSSNDIFLGSIRLHESFKGWGMRYKPVDKNISFSLIKRIKNLKLKLIMGVEGGLIKEDFRNMWSIGGNEESNKELY